MLLTPEQSQLVCVENREAVLELPADGHLIAMKLSGGETSGRNSRLVMRLVLWADLRGPRHPGLQLQLAEIWAG